MPIIRNSTQSTESLDEFYSDLFKSDDVFSSDFGKNMLLLLSEINKKFKKTEIWGLTSLYTLVIQNIDDFASARLITIAASRDQFWFEYLMKQEQAPWPLATVRGTATSLSKAVQFFAIAMRESGGWESNTELQQVLFET